MNDKTTRLLLIEDDKVDQMAFERFAGSENLPYDYTIAGSIAEAKDILKSISFDVIVSDYKLGDGTSFELFDLFKDIPVIVTTGTGNEEVAVEAMKLGAYDYLIKDPEGNYLKTLPLTVDLALKRKQTEKELRNHQNRLESMVKERTAQLEAEIIERTQAEEALQESEAKYRSMMEAMKDPVYISSPDYRVEYMNPAMIKRTGRDANAEYCFKALHDLDEKCPWCVNHIIQQNKCAESDIISPKDNRSYHVSHSPIVHENGSISKMTVYRDTTDFNEIEEQLRQAQKMEAIGTLTGGIAHDFNNLLTSIIGNAEIALMDVIKDESLLRQIENIKKAGEKAASLTRQLLAFSRKQVIKPEVLDLNIVIKETEKMLKRMIGEDIEFQTILEPEVWKVHMDSGQVDQMIINMALNARDAMPQGGKLTVEVANVDLDENYLREHVIKGTPGHYIMLAISDTGSGMDKETQEHIFEPFFTTKELGKGTGLGLSTVYGIIKQNKGFIWVYSEPGHGTTFKIYLPKVKEGVEPEEKERTPVGDLNGSETIFIVEDDDGLRSLARKILERYGYSILEAENGKDALRVNKKQEGSIHLMITDVIMPKTNGRELAKRLESLRPEMKVIYMSGYTDNAIVHHGVLAPGLNFLEKPFSPKDLARKVREVLDQGN